MRKARTRRVPGRTGDLAPQDQLGAAGLDPRPRPRRCATTDGFRTLGDGPPRDRADGEGGDTLGHATVLVHEIAERIIDAIDRPTLLAFDDLQWADELSLEVIGELARLGRDRPLLARRRLPARRAARPARSTASGGRGC